MLSTPEAELIRALGGTKTVAKIAKVGESAISNYRRNGFPARLHYVLAKACQQKGIYVPDRLLGGKQTKWAGQPAKKADEDFVRDGLLNLFLQNNYEYIKTPILQPTDLFIARLGEKMRSRLYTLASPLRETLCLRPDLTIPTCRYYLDNHQKGTKRYCYQGIGFRYQDSHSKKPAEFIQTGIELIGGENDLQDDMEGGKADWLSH